MTRKLHLKADTALAEVERSLPFTLVNPENADAVRRKFLRKPYEPEFTYPSPPDLSELRAKLTSIKCGKIGYGKLLARERELLLLKCDMVESIGTKGFGSRAAAVYGAPDKQLVKHAYGLLELPEAQQDGKIHADEVRALMRKAFELLSFRYAIKRTNMVSSAYISPATRTVLLKRKQRFGKLYTYRLAVHELGTHALRAENGRQQDLGIFARGTPGYLATEEGFAAYNEERAGVMTTDILRAYAGRVVAVAYAQDHTFVETFRHLRKWFGKEKAFTLTLRAKRGMGHGEQKGACTKDHLYLKGYLAVKEYVSGGGDLKPLYAAKIGIDDIPAWGGKLKAPRYSAQPLVEWVRHELVKEKVK